MGNGHIQSIPSMLATLDLKPPLIVSGKPESIGPEPGRTSDDKQIFNSDDLRPDDATGNAKLQPRDHYGVTGVHLATTNDMASMRTEVVDFEGGGQCRPCCSSGLPGKPGTNGKHGIPGVPGTDGRSGKTGALAYTPCQGEHCPPETVL